MTAACGISRPAKSSAGSSCRRETADQLRDWFGQAALQDHRRNCRLCRRCSDCGARYKPFDQRSRSIACRLRGGHGRGLWPNLTSSTPIRPESLRAAMTTGMWMTSFCGPRRSSPHHRRAAVRVAVPGRLYPGRCTPRIPEPGWVTYSPLAVYLRAGGGWVAAGQRARPHGVSRDSETAYPGFFDQWLWKYIARRDYFWGSNGGAGNQSLLLFLADRLERTHQRERPRSTISTTCLAAIVTASPG